MMGGRAPMAIATMWCLTAITIIFVALRLYTRVVVVNQLGWDDHIFLLSGVSVLVQHVNSVNILVLATKFNGD